MKRERKLIMRFVLLLASCAVLIFALATPTIARYVSKAGNDVENDFAPASSVTATVNGGKLSNGSMSNVYISIDQTIQYPVYVRVAILVNYKNGGDVFFLFGDDKGYSLNLNLSGKWKEIEDSDNFTVFYYYTEPLISNSRTEDLISSLTATSKPSNVPAGYDLDVEIIVETVQAIGKNGTVTALEDAWGITPDFKAVS